MLVPAALLKVNVSALVQIYIKCVLAVAPANPDDVLPAITDVELISAFWILEHCAPVITPAVAVDDNGTDIDCVAEASLVTVHATVVTNDVLPIEIF